MSKVTDKYQITLRKVFARSWDRTGTDVDIVKEGKRFSAGGQPCRRDKTEMAGSVQDGSTTGLLDEVRGRSVENLRGHHILIDV